MMEFTKMTERIFKEEVRWGDAPRVGQDALSGSTSCVDKHVLTKYRVIKHSITSKLGEFFTAV